MNSHFVYVEAAKSASGERWQRDYVFAHHYSTAVSRVMRWAPVLQPRSHCSNTCTTIHNANQLPMKFHRGNYFK